MKKFLVLYKAPIEEFQKAMTTMTPEQQKESMAEWFVRLLNSASRIARSSCQNLYQQPTSLKDERNHRSHGNHGNAGDMMIDGNEKYD